MSSIIGNLTDRYPQLPTLVANTVVGKVIQLIKSKAIDPVFDRERTVQNIQSWPPTVQMAAEWVMYTLSGVVRTMPNQEHPVGIIIQEGLAEALTQVGMKIDDVSVADRMEIIDVTMPVIRGQLVQEVRGDSGFKKALMAIGAGTKEFTAEAGSRMSRYRKALRDKRLGGK